LHSEKYDVFSHIIITQEAWMMPFAFCTREKRWCEFAEPVDGESTQFLQEYARKYNMVIINPILERDVNHGETLWNTAIIIGNRGNIIGKHRKVILMLFVSVLCCSCCSFSKHYDFAFYRTIYLESVISMKARITWKEIPGILCLRRLMERLLSIYVMGGTIH
jgi:hypothetical protein